MSALFPAMLAGLAGLAIPVALHMIARHRFPVQPFPSLRLLSAERRTNVMAMRLIDIPQLLLRLLVLLLLVLAMARLFSGALGFLSAPQNVVVVLDASASMRMRTEGEKGEPGPSVFARARRRARALLEPLEAPDQGALVVAGAGTRVAAGLEPGATGALAALEDARATDGTGEGLVPAVGRACSILAGRREARSHVVVLTDQRASAFAARPERARERIAAARRRLGDRLRIRFVDLAPESRENLGIVDGRLLEKPVQMGSDAHVLSTVFNAGTKKRTAKLRLNVGDGKETRSREIEIAPGRRAVVDMTTRISRATRVFAKTTLDGDSLAVDDRFDLPLNVEDARRVLLVSPKARTQGEGAGGLGALGGGGEKSAQSSDRGGPDGATILEYVLNPGRQLGLASGTGVRIRRITPSALGQQTLSKYDVTVLYGVSSLSERGLEDLHTFAEQGKAVLIVPGMGANAAKFNRRLARGGEGRGPLSPASITNVEPVDPAVSIRVPVQAHPVVAPFRDRRQGNIRAVSLTRLRGVRRALEGAERAMIATDGRPLALERAIGEGRSMLLLFGLGLEGGNIARTRVFPVLMWRLFDYLTGDLRDPPPDVLPAMRPSVIDASEPSFALSKKLRLTPAARLAGKDTAQKPLTLPVTEQRTVRLPPLPAGRYVLHRPRPKGAEGRILSYRRHITVNPSPRESRMARQSAKATRKALGGVNARVTQSIDAGALRPAGGELFGPLVALLILAYLAEAAFGFWSSAKRERARTEAVEREAE